MSSDEAKTSYIVECFWPDVRQEQVDAGAERVRLSAQELAREGKRIDFAGSIVVPQDDVVFYLLDGGSPQAVREACERAAIAYERIVRSVRRTNFDSTNREGT